MSSGRYEQQPHQQRYHRQSHRTVGGQSRWVARTATTTTTTTTTAATSTSSATLSTAAAAVAQQPAVLDQIANLLNLAQNLMSSVKEQQQRKQRQRQQQQQRSGAERYTTRRNLRLQAAAPYQRLATEPQRTLPSARGRHSNGSASANSQSNANANSILNLSAGLNSSDASNGGDGDGDGGSAITNGGQLNETQFCSCAECSARKLRSEVVVVGGGHCGAVTATDATPKRAANSNYMQHRNCNGSNSNNSNNNNTNNNNNSRHTSTNFQCTICLESYLLQRPMATLCGHIFCRLCILESLNCQGKCPICNRKLNLTNVFRVFF